MIIPHFYAEGIEPSILCSLHNWSFVVPSKRARVIDAIIFSVELDLLEIRLQELLHVVDVFIILESARTFTGIAKSLDFYQSRSRFAFAEHKIVYFAWPGRSLLPNEDPFVIEGEQRAQVDVLINIHARSGDLVIMSDVDEIPSMHTIRLLSSCSGVPFPLHLQLRNYVYSFEYFLGLDSWRAQVHTYKKFETSYRHSITSNYMLADSGWHCSFCMRTIEQIAFKMKVQTKCSKLKLATKDVHFISPVNKTYCFKWSVS